MEEKTYKKLFELSFKTDSLVTPLILDYYQFKNFGLREKEILDLIEKEYNPIRL